jgi:predicted  nucleic acid-binding Zn-ribbon protein
MLSPLLEKLLILQDRDLKRLGVEALLKAVPAEIAVVERTIAAEKGAIESSRTGLRELESKKKLLETEIGSAETQLGKYRTQQLGVRKNDEYQALGHEIATTQGQIGELEGQELEVMYSIDEAKKKLAGAEAVMKANIAGHEAKIRGLRERETGLKGEHAAILAEVAEARTPVEVPAIRLYDRLAPRGMPVVVSLRDSKCGGCHLKVSSEIESAARGKSPTAELAICDQCGRILYYES